MKKILFLFILLNICSFLNAQDKVKKTPEEKAKKKTIEMVSSLKLTKEQDVLIYSTNLKVYQSIQKYDTKEHSKKDKKKQKDIAQNLRDKEFKRILTPAQFKLYIALDKADDAKKDAEKEAKKKEKKEKKKDLNKTEKKDKKKK
jgi:hypothetical protein